MRSASWHLLTSTSSTPKGIAAASVGSTGRQAPGMVSLESICALR